MSPAPQMVPAQHPAMIAALGAAVVAGPPAAVVQAASEKALTCLLDFLACAFEARDLPWSAQARASIDPNPAGAVVLGSRERAAPAEAAFVNGVLGHGLVREDMHPGSIAHLGVVVWPALLALVERRRPSGADLIEAAITGYEVGARLGRLLVTAELARLFRPTGLVGPIAGAAAAARLLGLDARGAANAMALAANTSSGLNQWPHSGASDMYFHPGFAARSAVTAARLAAAGAEGSEAILEGEAGLFAAFARRAAPAAPVLFEGGDAEILHVFNKPVPACNYAQTPCQVAQDLAPRTGGSGSVRAIAIAVSDQAVRYPGCDGTGPFVRALQAKMSIPFGVAAALVSGTIAEANYARMDDPEILRLVRATTLTADPVLSAAYPGRQGAWVALTLADGRVIEGALDDVVFAAPEFVRSRFDAAAAGVLGAGGAAALRCFAETLRDRADAAPLAALCQPPPAIQAERDTP